MNSPFFWFDVMTKDVAASMKFYSSFTGWTAQEFMGGAYHVINAGPVGLGGFMSNKPQEPGKPESPQMWLGYVHVSDVDATVKRAEKLGAKTIAPPQDIPTVGRFSVLADPQGAGFAVFKPTPPDGSKPTPGMSNEPGRICWAELYTSDHKKAWTFYSELFNWKHTESMDMKEMGTYAMFNFGSGDSKSTGGMMNATHAPPHWMYYITVKDTDAAAKQVTAAGGKIINGPMDVPGGTRIAQCMDPQGIPFGIANGM
jgi:predicted enzyme related to lactoylglutathione lyase